MFLYDERCCVSRRLIMRTSFIVLIFLLLSITSMVVTDSMSYTESYDPTNTTTVPTNPNPRTEMVFYSTPKQHLNQEYNVETETCTMPKNEAFFIQKSQIAPVPDCRLSTLRSTFEKNICHRPFVNREPLV